MKRFQPGDHLLGWCEGAFAEYACADESHFVPKPAALSFEAAATLAMAGCTALQGLRDVAGVQPGQEVLIIGAGGGVGTYAVQIAKELGARVTGVCSTTKTEPSAPWAPTRPSTTHERTSRAATGATT